MSYTSAFKNLDEITAEKSERKQPASPSNNFFNPKSIEQKEPAQHPAPSQPAQTQAQQPFVPKLDKARAEMSGAANAYIWGGTIEIFWGTIETIVNNFSMSQAEKKLLIASRVKPQEKWTNEDKIINQKFNDLFKTHQERKKQIKLTEEENKALKYAYTLYAEVTGKETDPSAIKWAAIIRIMAGKGLDIYG